MLIPLEINLSKHKDLIKTVLIIGSVSSPKNENYSIIFSPSRHPRLDDFLLSTKHNLSYI